MVGEAFGGKATGVWKLYLLVTMRTRTICDDDPQRITMLLVVASDYCDISGPLIMPSMVTGDCKAEYSRAEEGVCCARRKRRQDEEVVAVELMEENMIT